ncbi:DUF3299 domain-containing protein [Ferrimonas sp. SCSIO 43195]|uniref:DUF3299 domain-containing protein n=1 Tax=Ferrimonas sp. SCSIO 43195 TaxID=2822844 RepID=UPI002075046E|nr:DUF3299 domain-containing protein [Ferrimonas sp. SCSIO 43195]USD37494.1 DUF3299 domain-containing protein [Ferrimonas sp. SCSIO 43195]
MKLIPLLLLTALLSGQALAAPHSLLWADLNANANASSVFERINPELNGQQVVIPGFVIENSVASHLGDDHHHQADSDQPTITVLSPQPEICFHKPPPPANQLIQVKLLPGVKVKATEGKPVYLIGELQVEKHLSGLFSTAYTLVVSDTAEYPSQ